MAKAKPVEPLALEALVRSLGDPVPRLLHGSKTVPGFFPGAAATDKAAAKYCVEQGWLVPTGEAVGTGKARKELYRIAPAGLQAVVAKSDSSELLRGLATQLARLQEQAADLPHAATEAALTVDRQLAALTAELKQGLADAFRPLHTVPAAVQELKTLLAAALQKVKPLDLDALTRQLSTPLPTTGPRQATNWGDDVVRMAAEQKQQNPFQRLTLPQVFDRLRRQHPELTLGQFHDGLRRLVDEKRIRLGPYTQALATLDDTRTALFLDREVKFYVELP